MMGYFEASRCGVIKETKAWGFQGCRDRSEPPGKHNASNDVTGEHGPPNRPGKECRNMLPEFSSCVTAGSLEHRSSSGR